MASSTSYSCRVYNHMAGLSLALIGMLLQFGVHATPVAAEGSEDELFSSSELFSEVEEGATAIAPEEELLKSDKVQLGGRFTFTMGSNWKWNSVDLLRQNGFRQPSQESLDTKLQGTLFLDARPDINYRVFGKAVVTYPFVEQAEDAADLKNLPENAGEDIGKYDHAHTRKFDDIVHVTELFADFNHDDKVFFRAGKQTINWGVGYFFSPADIVNLTPIDPEDPEAEREGPLSVKANMPVGPHNLYLYVMADNAQTARDLAIAPKAEIVVGPAELGLGAFYQRNRAPEAMATISTALGDFAVFGEAVYKQGSDKRFVRAVPVSAEHPLGVEVYKRNDEAFFSGTAGLRYGYSDDDGRFNLSFAGQYFYNGEGYDDPKTLMSVAYPLLMQKQLTASDIAYAGKQQYAANLAWTDALKSGVNANVLLLGSPTDHSGQVTGSLAWEPMDNVTTTIGMSYNYGKAGSQYAYAGNPVGLFFKVSLGSGQF